MGEKFAPRSAADIAGDVLESLHEGCQVISEDFRYLYVNQTVCAQGRRTRDELIGRTMMECYPGIEQTAMFAMLRRCLIERRHSRMENEFSFPDGSCGWFELRFIPVSEGVCILSLDNTESKRVAQALARSEEQLRQAQKMEAIGRLAGGVAHDFNNLLSVILGYSALILGDADPQETLAWQMLEIKKAGERAADLTRQLLAFSRQQVLSPRILNLNEVVAGLLKMVRPIVREDIGIRTVLDPDLGKVKSDRVQLELVLMNLIVNARDAMPTGGTVTIETQNVNFDDVYAAQHLGVQPGPHVMLVVSDTGHGMDKATQERIFEPFFTTKKQGAGTGLGLATVFGIVRQSGGSIWVYSEPGKGASFKIYFPRSSDTDSQAASPSIDVASLRGSETLLLVEDDEQLRILTRGILERSGYCVFDAANGTEALAIWDKYSDSIDLLLCDVVMPRLSGPDLAQQLMGRRPQLPVLFLSGYTESALAQHSLLAAGAAVLQKPVAMDALLRTLRQVLEQARATHPSHIESARGRQSAGGSSAMS